ncbi:hypothetical protein HU200_003234 [Digitaria exilis]|uniref:Bifunctional inhibitor/plant lipid transfer protein/seed storage helical domain-containing protein n=1 Tax=Digitaria exilis TaxID=1010633 RepID=A0A835FWH3_9POAL|nr:hypothetical protein HU200_003234 [Digitaria exilis]
MAMKVILRVLVFALVFCMLANHQASGEMDCYGQKENVKLKCKKSIDIIGYFVRPRLGDKCCQAVDASDMVCVSGAFTEEELKKISCIYFFHVAKDCGHPLPVGTKCGSKYLILLLFFSTQIHVLILLGTILTVFFLRFDCRTAAYNSRVVHKTIKVRQC